MTRIPTRGRELSGLRQTKTGSRQDLTVDFFADYLVSREKGNKSKALHPVEIYTVNTVFFGLFALKGVNVSFLFSTKDCIRGQKSPTD
ncbi:MAG TPA: hypothetical protein VFQ43_01960, partial [Nitrososphaera sp.]|nr:hypothetical protein [Nitrososphaera sp.]